MNLLGDHAGDWFNQPGPIPEKIPIVTVQPPHNYVVHIAGLVRIRASSAQGAAGAVRQLLGDSVELTHMSVEDA